MLKKVCCKKSYNLNQSICDICGKKLEAKVFCDKCGAEIPNGAANCKKCGALVNSQNINAQNANVQMKSNQIKFPTIKKTKKNKIIVIVLGIIVIFIFALLIFTPRVKKQPIVGKWTINIENNNYPNQMYVEFKSNGTYNVNTLGEKQSGKYKIIENGNPGKVRIMPNGSNSSSYDMNFNIKGDILTLDNQQFKKVK